MSFLRKGLLVSGGQVLAMAMSLLISVLYSRTLGPDGMGQFELFRSTSAIAMTLFTLGLGPAIIYCANSQQIPMPTMVTNVVKIALVLGGVGTGVMVAVLLVFPAYFGHVSLIVVVGFSVGVSASMATALLRSVLVARLAARRMVTVTLARYVALLVGGGVLAVGGLMGPQAALIVLALSSLSALIVAVTFLRRHIDLRLPFQWGLLGRMLSYGLRLGTAGMLSILASQLTVMLLRYLRPDQFTDVGLYTRAVAICSLVSLVPTTIGPLLYAKWSGIGGTARDAQVEMATRMNVTYGLAAAVGVVVLGEYLLWVLYGAEFIAAVASLRILAPAVRFIAISSPCNNLLASDGRAAITAWMLAGTVVVVGTVSYLLIPPLGIRGAALAALCGNGFTALSGLAVCARLYGLNPARCLILRRSDLIYLRGALVG